MGHVAEAASGSETANAEEPQLSVKEQLEVLKARLQEAIRKEEYEDAAQYRDQIRQLSREEETNA